MNDRKERQPNGRLQNIMMCQNCGQRQATCHFAVNQNGRGGEAHLCAECAGRYAGQYRRMLVGMLPFAGALAGSALLQPGPLEDKWAVQTVPAGPFPAEGSPDPVFQRRRELELLRRGLDDAVANEDFERAVSLRDEIRRLEQAANEPAIPAKQHPEQTTEKDEK